MANEGVRLYRVELRDAIQLPGARPGVYPASATIVQIDRRISDNEYRLTLIGSWVQIEHVEGGQVEDVPLSNVKTVTRLTPEISQWMAERAGQSSTVGLVRSLPGPMPGPKASA